MAAHHLLLALSPHGYGHAAMSAPILEEIAVKLPHLRLTIQTSLPRDWLATRYAMEFELIANIPDFGLVMRDANTVDVEASLLRYERLFDGLDAVVEAETDRLAHLQPDLVMANIPFVTIIAARRLGIPVVAFSSLNWADILETYGGVRAAGYVAAMRRAYASADWFLKLAPALPMDWLPGAVSLGAVARTGTNRSAWLRRRLALSSDTRLGLLAFGGMDAGIDPARIVRHARWHWILGQGADPARPDMSVLAALDLSFVDVVASVDAVVTKPGYGMFTEAAANTRPLVYLDRPDWPETRYLTEWARRHVPCAAIDREMLYDTRLTDRLDGVLAEPVIGIAATTGGAEAAGYVLRALGFHSPD